jgi:FkbM family methyltransferase
MIRNFINKRLNSFLQRRIEFLFPGIHRISVLKEIDEKNTKKMHVKSKNNYADYIFFPKDEVRYSWIKDLNINTILDVGANIGESAAFFQSLLPDSFIYCFEPLKESYEQLIENTRLFSNIKSFNFALGNIEGQSEIIKNDFSPSSSILEMEKTHKEIFPFTENEAKETIEIKRLDDFIKKHDLKQNILLKIDTQGYEISVLEGAIETLKMVKLIIVETSFIRLYKNQPLFIDVFNYLRNLNFEYFGSWDQLLDVRNGKPIQQDAIFIKNN